MLRQLTSLWQITVIAFINEGIRVTRLKINVYFMFFLLLYRTSLRALAMPAVWQDFRQICGRSVYLHLLKKTLGHLRKSNTQMERSGGSIKPMMIKQHRDL